MEAAESIKKEGGGVQIILNPNTASAIDTSDANITPGDVLDGKIGYGSNGKVIGNIPAVTQATPSITLAKESGLITVTSNQPTGHVLGGTKTVTKQLSVKGKATYTPGTRDQKIVGGYYLTGSQTIKGDPNLVAANIKKGVSIFGVSGSYSGGSSAKVNVTFDSSMERAKIYDSTGKKLNANTTYSLPSGSIVAVLFTGDAGSYIFAEPDPSIQVIEETGDFSLFTVKDDVLISKM